MILLKTSLSTAVADLHPRFDQGGTPVFLQHDMLLEMRRSKRGKRKVENAILHLLQFEDQDAIQFLVNHLVTHFNFKEFRGMR